MKTQTIAAEWLSTICWYNNSLVDWAFAGKQYELNGEVKQLGRYGLQYKFDACITSNDGQFAFVYERLGTKGLVLKNGELLREINRSYYCASAYEYPAVFVTHKNITYLIHCPSAYNQLDFENAETGEVITAISGRNPEDMFYSRLEISPSKTYLMSKGWVWHPLSVISVFVIEDCLHNPLLLDHSNIQPDFGSEICTASFISDTKILIGSSNEVYDDELVGLPAQSVMTWDITSHLTPNPVKVKGDFGNLFVIDETFAWDMYKHPKIINYKTGEITIIDDLIDSGNQNSSIINENDNFPQITLNQQTKQIAIKGKDKIIVLTP